MDCLALKNADAKNGPASRARRRKWNHGAVARNATTECEVDPAQRQISQTGSNHGSEAKRQKDATPSQT
jgi:hypothetical protein